MASGHTGNVVPGNRLRVRISCPPLSKFNKMKASVVNTEAFIVLV